MGRASCTRWVVALLLVVAAGGRMWGQAETDLSAYVSSEDARLGTGSGTIVLSQAGRLGRPVTLGKGHNLEVRAAVTWTATMRLMGQNQVRCTQAGSIVADMPDYTFAGPGGMLLLAEGTSGVGVSGCRVSAKAQSVLLVGMPASGITMRGNALSGLTLLATHSPGGSPASDGVVVENNTVTMGPGSSHNAGVLLFYARHVQASGNTLTGLGHGIQWWGGNSGEQGASLAKVTAAGQMQFVGNHCKDIGGACIWGSMGSDVVIHGNDADGCGDVCFDTEGGLRTEISGNTATKCRNGCAAVFFFSDYTTVSGNHFRADAPGGGLIFIKNASQNPLAHGHLVIEGNELRCMTGVCRAVYQEAASGIRYTRNQVNDGVWAAVGYARDVVLANNKVEFTRVIAGTEPGFGAAFGAPAVLASTPLEISGNEIRSAVVQTVPCIAAAWSDYNSMGFGLIAGNQCGPAGMFPVGVQVTSAGRNPGLAGIWYVGANRLNGGRVEHTADGSHEAFHDLGQCGSGGRCVASGVELKTGIGGPGCAAAAMPGAVCMGPASGYVAVPEAQ